ncbi:hypothetical protein GC163_21350 [bacterium]|nr:hypothetical protein [bacterium]
MTMDLVTSLTAVATFAAVAMLVVAMGRWLFGIDSRVDDRLNQLQEKLSVMPAGEGSMTSRWLWFRATPRSGIQLRTKHVDEFGKLQTRLMHAGVYSPWALQIYTTVKLVLMITPTVICFVPTLLGWWNSPAIIYAGAILSGIGMLLPGLWLQALKRRRHQIFTWSMPDFLDLLVTCLEAGMSIEAAWQRVADEVQRVHPLLGGELKAVRTQIELGATPETALRSFADRSDFDPIRSLSTVVQQSRRFGTGMAEALRQHANALRVQREHAAEEKAQKASVQILMPTMLLIFPAIFIVLAGPAAIKLSETFANQDRNAGSASPRSYEKSAR